MPYKIEHRGDKYVVINEETGAVKAEHATEAKAKAQIRLLAEVEKMPEWDQ